MQAEMEDQLEAERGSGLFNAWRQVYQLMRCRDKSCKKGTHCFEDPVTQKHDPLIQHHLQSLLNFVHDGGTLFTENDIPDWFHEQLQAEEKVLKPKSKSKSLSVHEGTCPLINIVLPTQTTTPIAAPSTSSPNASSHKRLDIPGPRDLAVKEYSEWHASKVHDDNLKKDYEKACQVALENGLDLQQIFSRPDPSFFIEREVKIGTAHRFVDDITEWVQESCVSPVYEHDSD